MTPEYYATVAQIIPLLLLTLVFEARFTLVASRIKWSRILVRIVFGLAAVGECLCLHALRDPNVQSSIYATVVWITFLLPFALVLGSLMSTIDKPPHP